jgi:hypothetical protein
MPVSPVLAYVQQRCLLTNLVCLPHLLQLLQQAPPIVHDRIHPVARQLRVVAVDHRAAVRQVFGEKVAQPHAAEVAFAAPRAVRVAVKAGDGDDAARTKSAARQHQQTQRAGCLNEKRRTLYVLCSDRRIRLRRVQLGEAKEVLVEADVRVAHVHLPLHQRAGCQG